MRLKTALVWVRKYFNRESADPLLNQMDSSDFTWRTKNFLWDELNIRKTELYVKNKRPSVVTDLNQACFVNMTGRRKSVRKHPNLVGVIGLLKSESILPNVSP
jgi:hypothetical protein